MSDSDDDVDSSKLVAPVEPRAARLAPDFLAASLVVPLVHLSPPAWILSGRRLAALAAPESRASSLASSNKPAGSGLKLVSLIPLEWSPLAPGVEASGDSSATNAGLYDMIEVVGCLLAARSSLTVILRLVCWRRPIGVLS